MIKIEVRPTLALQASHIFKDSRGNRQTLNPAETLEDVEKTAQEFDGSDPLVAKKIISQLTLKPPTVKVSTADKKILYAALDALDRAEAVSKKGAKSADKAVAEALAEAEKQHAEALAEAEKRGAEALDTAVKDAVAKAEKKGKSK